MVERRACVYLVRHGETDWNRMGKLQGQTDTSLTDKGRQQADEVGAYFEKLARDGKLEQGKLEVISSDLKRTMDTAAAIRRGIDTGMNSELEITLDDRLREHHLGVLQGYTWEQAMQKQPEAFRQLHGADDDARPAGGESENDVKLRTFEAFRAICCRALKAGTHDVTATAVVVSHGGALHAMSHNFGFNHDGGESLKNCSVSAVVVSLEAQSVGAIDQALDSGAWWDEAERKVVMWGHTSHLSGESMQDLQSKKK